MEPSIIKSQLIHSSPKQDASTFHLGSVLIQFLKWSPKLSFIIYTRESLSTWSSRAHKLLQSGITQSVITHSSNDVNTSNFAAISPRSE